jgi:hypothetical protein
MVGVGSIREDMTKKWTYFSSQTFIPLPCDGYPKGGLF